MNKLDDLSKSIDNSTTLEERQAYKDELNDILLMNIRLKEAEKALDADKVRLAIESNS